MYFYDVRSLNYTQYQSNIGFNKEEVAAQHPQTLQKEVTTLKRWPYHRIVSMITWYVHWEVTP